MLDTGSYSRNFHPNKSLASLSIQHPASVSSIQHPATNTKIIAPIHVPVSAVETTMNQIDVRLNELQALRDKLKSEKDALSDMSQQDKMKLQRATDKRSKIERALSNLMKKFSDTSAGIIQNMK